MADNRNAVAEMEERKKVARRLECLQLAVGQRPGGTAPMTLELARAFVAFVEGTEKPEASTHG
jgi:hypothetical protein